MQIARDPSDRIRLLASGWDVAPMVRALAASPELWDRDTARTAPEASPHHGLSDIWCRFAADTRDAGGPHVSTWRMEPDTRLPIRAMANRVMDLVGATQLGGVLITRIPPGKSAKPHTDQGWHARHYEKVAVQIAAAPGQEFHFEGQSLVTKPGDVFFFDNAYTHWVTNESPVDRITAIFCVRGQP